MEITEADHTRGSNDPSALTLVMYGDFQCPFTAKADEEIVEALELLDGELKAVFRHFPLAKHQEALPASLAAEAAASQGSFWEMHELLFAQDGELGAGDLRACAERIGLDVDRFTRDMSSDETTDRIKRDTRSGVALDVSGTPTFFMGDERHYGDHDVEFFVSWARRLAAARM